MEEVIDECISNFSKANWYFSYCPYEEADDFLKLKYIHPQEFYNDKFKKAIYIPFVRHGINLFISNGIDKNWWVDAVTPY